MYTLKSNPFYRQITEDLKRHKSTKFTKSQNIDKDFRCPFLIDFNYITEDTYEINMQKRKLDEKTPYQ